MTKTIEKLEAAAQLDRAVAALGEALEKAQGIDTSEQTAPHIERMTEMLAESLRHVYGLKTAGLVSKDSLASIRSAMSRLRSAMTQLQTGGPLSQAAEGALRMTARTLALLYPVFTLIEQLADARNSRPSGPPSSPPPADSEHRERRSTLRCIVEVDIGLHADTNFFTGFSADVSAGGLFVSTYDVLPIGTKVNVNFSLPAGPILSINGMVRWVRELNEMTPEVMPGMGIQFENLAAEDAELINRYMSDIPPMFYA